jgi:hypothetical protein
MENEVQVVEREESEEVTGLREELTAVREALQVMEREREAGREAAAAQVAELTAEVETLRGQVGVANDRVLEAHRRTILAEHAGRVVPELITGNTVEELDASAERALAAYARVVEAARSQLVRQQVPMGASPRFEPEVDSLSPLQKITSALRRRD